MKKLRVLLIAEAANPEWASVPLVGWSHASALAQVCDAHVVTQVRNRDAFLRAGWTEGREFTAIDSEKVAGPIHKISKRLPGGFTTGTAMISLTYYYFEYLVWKQFGERIRRGDFDVVHRVTPLSPTTPSLLAKKCHGAGVPFILGPLNGGAPWPKGSRNVIVQEREWLTFVRDAYKLLPAYRATRQKAAAIVVGSGHTRQQIGAKYFDKCVYIPENGIDPKRFALSVERPPALPLRLAFVGRLVPYKGPSIVLEAAAPLIKAGSALVDIIGDGPEMEKLKHLVQELGIEQGVTFAGWVQHHEIQHRMVQSDVFVFPSIREFGGGVVLEAMALGLVPIIVDYAGPAELLTDDSGIKVPMGTHDELVQRFRDALMTLVNEPSRILAMRQRGRERVWADYTWEAKAQQVLQVYRWVLGAVEKKPDFFDAMLDQDYSS